MVRRKTYWGDIPPLRRFACPRLDGSGLEREWARMPLESL